jgi:hypothetical protein
MPADPIHPDQLAAPTRSPTWTACPSVSWLGCWRAAGDDRITIIHKLSDCGPAWARPASHLAQAPRRRAHGPPLVAGGSRRPARRPPQRPTRAVGRPERRPVGQPLACQPPPGRCVAERRLAEALRRPAPTGSERLSEAQAIPAGFLVGFAEGCWTAPPSCCGRDNQPRRPGRWRSPRPSRPSMPVPTSAAGSWTKSVSAGWPMMCSVWRTSTATITATRPSKPAPPPWARSWRANAPARTSRRHGCGRPSRLSGRSAGGARNAALTATTAEPPAARPSSARGFAARRAR